jgi:hypothetical protein
VDQLDLHDRVLETACVDVTHLKKTFNHSRVQSQNASSHRLGLPRFGLLRSSVYSREAFSWNPRMSHKDWLETKSNPSRDNAESRETVENEGIMEQMRLP